MAVYKVIQDIEAEDKLLGPLTLKQFIWAVICCGFIFAAFLAATKIKIYAAIPFLPFIFATGVLAAPLGRDQPTDVWLAAQIRFRTKPRKRIWNQAGLKELVTITAPKKVEKIYTNGLSQGEVKGRLKALAETIDSRGWVIKNLDAGTYSAQQMPYSEYQSYDRLIDPMSLPKPVNDSEVPMYEDIMDESSTTAKHFTEMVDASTKNLRQKAIDNMQNAVASPDATVSPPISSENSVTLNNKVNSMPLNNSSPKATLSPSPKPINLKHDNPTTQTPKIRTTSTTKTKNEKLNKPNITTTHKSAKKTTKQNIEQVFDNTDNTTINRVDQTVTPAKNPAIVEIAKNSDDIPISVVAKIAEQKIDKIKQTDEGEVIIKLR